MLTILLAAAAATQPVQVAPGITLIEGQVTAHKGPDGNSIFIEAPEGLILVDTGRHPEHRDRLLAFARERKRPIAAIVNTHWHLDHATGNGDIRAAHPKAEIYATPAVEGALKTFLRDSRERTEAGLAAGQIPPERQAEVRRFLAVMADPAPLRPDHPFATSSTVTIAGKALHLNVAPFAATEADLWIYDPATKVAIVGDLVVDVVPFMDTACPEGWRTALDAIAATPFVTLVPGHGKPMTRVQFQTWRTAYDNLLDCAAGSQSSDACAMGWRRDAAEFVAGEDPGRIEAMTKYYLEMRLRAKPEERERYCRPLG
jgi:glyoxylase-like metal-dependent hydrolase (beta-lactamase superfamily II)